jgi:carbonic anhydrase/mannitol/fructose-specific phosphotransferase system IIA component (Ntr-type)
MSEPASDPSLPPPKFVEGALHFEREKFPAYRALFEKLAVAQTPDTLFITCSDSRIDPALITQSLPGDLFIIRNAGNIVPPGDEPTAGELASIEYAVKVLGVEHIVVCGHTKCGAMAGLLSPVSLQDLPTVGAWVDHARSALERLELEDLSEPDRLDRAVHENVRIQLDRLRAFPPVRERLVAGKLKLHGWVYRIEHGDVLSLNPTTGEFRPLGEDHEGVGAGAGDGAQLGALLNPELVMLDVKAESFDDVCAELLGRVRSRGLISATGAGELRRSVAGREQVASTAIGLGVACPHAYTEEVDAPVVVFARLRDPLNLGAPDGVPTDLIFLVISRPEEPRQHLQTLMRLSRLLQDAQFRDGVRRAEQPEDVIEAAVSSARAAETVVEESRWLGRAGIEQRTGRFAGGIIDDIRRRWTHYVDDFKQGLSMKALAATIFLFFACITAAVTFGAIMDAETGGAITTFDMIAATAFCGVIFALVGGQPLIILGGTGPLLIFTAMLYQLTGQWESIDFLPFYAWVGIWAGVFTLILAVTDASVWLRFLSRFTDEIFVLLIALIFIYEAIRLIAAEFEADTLISYSTAMSSLVLALGTFGIAVGLRAIRKGTLLRGWARNFLADFGTVIAIGAMATAAYFMRDTTELAHIRIPSEVSLNLSDYLVPIFSLPTWGIFLAILPGLCATILIFLDQQITARVVNAPQFHLKKGPGYHLDLVVVGGLVSLCSVLGLPWLVAATVRSLNHVGALATTHAEDRLGKTQSHIDGVLENRVTGVGIHVLIGLSIVLVPLLEMVPMACLYGIFLYMGIVSLSGVQFFERLTLWMKDPAMYPRTHYLRSVPTGVVHIYTLIQAGCLALLWVIKASALAVLFPVVLAMLVPVRWLLGRFFSEKHLEILDAEETPEEEEDHESS